MIRQIEHFWEFLAFLETNRDPIHAWFALKSTQQHRPNRVSLFNKHESLQQHFSLLLFSDMNSLSIPRYSESATMKMKIGAKCITRFESELSESNSEFQI